MAWRLARSLTTLRAQVDALYPGRSRVSDGSIGDAAHASRSSDHNPWVKIREGGRTVGIVTGLDLTHDPDDGMDSYALAETLRVAAAGGEGRVKYIISNGRIASAVKAWVWRVYSGKNPHDHHVHISVQPAQALFDDTTPWPLTPRVTPASTGPDTPLLAPGSKGEAVSRMQTLLIRAGFALPKYGADGDYGKGGETEKAVRAFQRSRGLLADGRVGGKTWRALLAI